MALSENSEEECLRRLVSERPNAVAPRIRYAETVAVRNRDEAVAILADGALFADGRDLTELAAALHRMDAVPEAIGLYQQAARQIPDDPDTFAGLACAWGALGEKDKAEAMAARARALGWQEEFPVFSDGQTLAGTRHLFDQYAARFDTHLTGTLQYRVPGQLSALIASALPDDVPLGDVLDIGCGTGLMGQYLRGRATRLTGIDLSPAMLREAERKQLYDRLIAGDAVAWLQQYPDGFDVIVAADVLGYVETLPPFLAAIARGLRRGGIMALSIEIHEGVGTVLLPSRRYTHAPAWLETVARTAGLQIVAQEAASPRHDAGRPVSGMNYLLRKLLA